MCKYRESTHVWRALMVVAAVPLLPLICVAVIDAIPMNSPDLGFAHSGTAWTRNILVGLVDSYALPLMFSLVPVGWQTMTALAIPAFKIIERNLICRYLRGKDDLMPEMVVFIVEITNALFISTSTQQAASAKTSAMLILIDFIHLLISGQN
ncbi:hypothetical protein PHMEG_00037431 [Phytophthora megakarya]|uniref:Uncharacterized protein n=1 Tax=Phytophthora megakarya TaxID=4795 RepID=A0A225UL17_9STRA|nr:hypothetical protein PHMEG_00037431 [Phytophthora megakarya]